MTRTASLGELLAKKSKGIVPGKMPDTVFELYSVPSFDTRKPEIVKGSEIGSNKQIVEPGTVLLCKINPRINRAWVVGSFSRNEKIASTEWITFPPHDDVDPRFLANFLRQENIRHFLAANASGVGGSLTRVKASTVENIKILLPSIEEQRIIVAEIEKQFSRLDEAIAGLQRIKANLKRYKAAVLKAAVEGRLVPTEADLARREGCSYETGAQLLQRILDTRRSQWQGKGKYKEPAAPDTAALPELPEGWVWSNVDQLAKVGTGATPLRDRSEYYRNGHIPWVTSAVVNQSHVDVATEFVTAAALEKTNLTLYPAGTLLIAMYGEGKTRGMCTELRIAATTNQALAALQASADVRDYLRLFLEHNYEETRKAASGGVQPNLNLNLVRSIRLPLPPLAEQHRLIAEVDRLLSIAREAGTEVGANLKRAQALRQACLSSAFGSRS